MTFFTQQEAKHCTLNTLSVLSILVTKWLTFSFRFGCLSALLVPKCTKEFCMNQFSLFFYVHPSYSPHHWGMSPWQCWPGDKSKRQTTMHSDCPSLLWWLEFSYWVGPITPSYLLPWGRVLPPGGCSGSPAPSVHQLCPANLNLNLCSNRVWLMDQLVLVCIHVMNPSPMN